MFTWPLNELTMYLSLLNMCISRWRLPCKLKEFTIASQLLREETLKLSSGRSLSLLNAVWQKCLRNEYFHKKPSGHTLKHEKLHLSTAPYLVPDLKVFIYHLICPCNDITWATTWHILKSLVLSDRSTCDSWQPEFILNSRQCEYRRASFMISVVSESTEPANTGSNSFILRK